MIFVTRAALVAAVVLLLTVLQAAAQQRAIDSVQVSDDSTAQQWSIDSVRVSDDLTGKWLRWNTYVAPEWVQTVRLGTPLPASSTRPDCPAVATGTGVVSLNAGSPVCLQNGIGVQGRFKKTQIAVGTDKSGSSSRPSWR